MGIQPIDLQTLYAQMEKVGKAQGMQQAGNQNAREAELIKNREEAEKRLSTVQETEAGDERSGVVHKRQKGSDETSQDEKERQDEKQDSETSDDHLRETIRDPSLGSHIDVSG